MVAAEPLNSEVTLRQEIRKQFIRFRTWSSPRDIVARVRDVRALSRASGTRVWRFHASTFIVVVLSLLVLFVAIAVDALFVATVLTAVGSALAWLCIVRPRLLVTTNEVIVVKWFRTIRFPLAEVLSAQSDYYGLTFNLVDTPSSEESLWQRTCSTSVLQTWNVTKWLGRESRADRVGALLTREAAVLRGEDPATDDVPEGRRGFGNLFMGFWTAITSFMR